jgi:hypothetical protein
MTKDIHPAKAKSIFVEQRICKKPVPGFEADALAFTPPYRTIAF